MTLPERIYDNVRRSRRTLYIIAGTYVLIGFGVALPAAVLGDRLSAFLGFLIVSGALAAAALAANMVRLSAHLSAVSRSLEEVGDRLARLEVAQTRGEPARSSAWPVQVLDLANVGSGDPAPLVAATLDREEHPRLTETLETAALSAPPVAGENGRATPTEPVVEPKAGHPVESALEEPPEPQAAESYLAESAPFSGELGVTPKNLFRQWRLGMKNGDLASCREVFAAIVDIADAETVATYRAELDELAERTERGLRSSFREQFLQNDFAAMLEVGDQICRLFPGRPAAEQFRRIKATLFQRCVETVGLTDETPAAVSEPPALRVVY